MKPSTARRTNWRPFKFPGPKLTSLTRVLFRTSSGDVVRGTLGPSFMNHGFNADDYRKLPKGTLFTHWKPDDSPARSA